MDFHPCLQWLSQEALLFNVSNKMRKWIGGKKLHRRQKVREQMKRWTWPFCLQLNLFVSDSLPYDNIYSGWQEIFLFIINVTIWRSMRARNSAGDQNFIRMFCLRLIFLSHTELHIVVFTVNFTENLLFYCRIYRMELDKRKNSCQFSKDSARISHFWSPSVWLCIQ